MKIKLQSIWLAVKAANARLQKEDPLQKFWEVLGTLCNGLLHIDFVPRLSGLIRARDIKGCVDYADWLVEQSYTTATEHFVANQLASLIRKYPFPDGSGFDPEGEALRKFRKAEAKCHRINQRFAARRRRVGKAWPFESLLHAMRRFIAYTIGDEVPLAKIWDECGFGPGATLDVTGDATNTARKIHADVWSVTPKALHYAYASVLRHAQLREAILPEHGGFSSGSPDTDWKRFVAKVSVVLHNKLAFVLKTVKIRRIIAKEPTLNGYLQTGVGRFWRVLLKRIGIDIGQQEPNQRMAREGSLEDSEDSFCTIDLSAASDSIATEVVRELLPPDWFAFLDALRSPQYEVEGVVSPFHKFCSMGNGFCFPLETLLFTAACVAVGAGRPGLDFRVYGDDIVIRRSKFDPLVDLLHYLGFTVNRLKTFKEGPFRESCGADYFRGKDVRPYTLDHAFDSVESIYKFLNLSRRNALTSVFFEDVRPIVLGYIPSTLHLYRPYKGEADSGIDSTGDEHLYCQTCMPTRCPGTWQYVELRHTPMADRLEGLDEVERATALVYAALSGSASARPFACRHRTTTKVRLRTHCGAESTWLPRPWGVGRPTVDEDDVSAIS